RGWSDTVQGCAGLSRAETVAPCTTQEQPVFFVLHRLLLRAIRVPTATWMLGCLALFTVLQYVL
ncbi:hypothetical protein, partial [Escherichia coli]|uniref:hypothetical protein n=1 Tax=Escherichia coli TaxID=562 RepID=UPI001F2E169B